MPERSSDPAAPPQPIGVVLRDLMRPPTVQTPSVELPAGVASQQQPSIRPPHSPATRWPRTPGCTWSCNRCQDSGALLATRAVATVERLVELANYRFGQDERVLVACTCAAGQERIAAWSGLPVEARGIRLDSGALWAIPDQRAASTAIAAFLAEPRGWVTLEGGYGTGKTTLMYAALNHLADVGCYGRYTTAPDLLDSLRRMIRQGGDMDAALERWTAAPVLAVDELDKVDLTDFAEKTLFRLFDGRYRRWATQGTLLAYNADREDRLPAFLRSRIRDGRFQHVELRGGDVRPALGAS